MNSPSVSCVISSIVGSGSMNRKFSQLILVILTPLLSQGYLPYVGMMTILMNDKPNLKYALLGLLALFVLIKREQ